MDSERRSSRRKPVVYPVVLSYTGVGLLRARTRDVSETGIFLELEHIKLNQFTEVDLGFSVRENDETTFHRLTGCVVRVTDDGAAVQLRYGGATVLKLLNSTHNYPTL